MTKSKINSESGFEILRSIFLIKKKVRAILMDGKKKYKHLCSPTSSTCGEFNLRPFLHMGGNSQGVKRLKKWDYYPLCIRFSWPLIFVVLWCKLAGAARYVGLLLAPAEVFGRGLFLPFVQKNLFTSGLAQIWEFIGDQ